MKKLILNTALFAFIAAGLISCKDKGTDAMTSDAKEVAQTSAAAVTYNVDTDASQILWKGSKPLKTHHGIISLKEGQVAVKENKIESGDFTIDMHSITDLDLEGKMKTNLENHLKGTVEGKEVDFFNVTKYPVSTFQLTGMTEKEGKTMISGNLTIKDKTNNIEFPATVTVDTNSVSIKSEPFVLDRTLWGVNFGSKTIFTDIGDKFISDEMEITIDVKANKSDE
ncbi:MAG: YceI family protein [Flavobacterium sp.]|nr:MAG: YceI family protein [Flavobacterium sp.]